MCKSMRHDVYMSSQILLNSLSPCIATLEAIINCSKRQLGKFMIPEPTPFYRRFNSHYLASSINEKLSDVDLKYLTKY